MPSPGCVNASVQKFKAGTIPGQNEIHSFSSVQLCLVLTQLIIDEKYSGDR